MDWSEAVRLAQRSRRQKATGRHDNWLQLALTFVPNAWFRLAIIHRAFHYVNSHPRGDPVYSLLNDKVERCEWQILEEETGPAASLSLSSRGIFSPYNLRYFLPPNLFLNSLVLPKL